MAELQAVEKKRADDIQAEKEKRADEIQMVKVEADKELAIKHMEPNAQAQASSSAAVDPPPRKRDAKSPKLPAFIDEKDELDSCLLHFECYAKNAKWGKTMWAIKLSALPTGRALDVCTRMSDTDANDYGKHS